MQNLSVEELSKRMTPERLEKLERALSLRTRHFTMVLEDLYDPHNISAVVRTCEVFGVQDVHVIEEINSYRINKSILKGSFKWLDIFRYRSRALCMERLRAKGYRIAVASTNTTRSFHDLDLTVPTAFYLGAELAGNNPETLAKADVEFILPQYGLTESMNVSVAGGVLLARIDEWMRANGGREKWALSGEDRERVRRDWFERQVFGTEENSPVKIVTA